jgi:hypothetical protein
MPTHVRPVLLLLLLFLVGCEWVPDTSNVKVNREPAGGLTDSSFDLDYLRQLIESTREAAQQRLTETYERNKVPPAERYSHATADGRYAQVGGRRLAVIELSYSRNPMRVTRIIGIEEGQLVTVSCISPRGAPIDPFAETGECAEGVREHLSALR